jgi:leucyl aminopeptidase (aminopeptidase T)
LKVKPDENLIIVYDMKRAEIAQAFEQAAKGIGSSPEMVKIQETGRHGAEPPQDVAEKIINSDVFIFPTTFSLSHTEARKKACEKGARGASLPNITAQLFPAINTDYVQLKEDTVKIGNAIKGVDKVRITSPSGCDIQFSIKGREFEVLYGDFSEKKIWGNLPEGEICGAPIIESANGTVVFNHWNKQNEIGKIKVVNGKAVEFEGQGTDLEKDLKAEGTEKALNIAELGIGTNRKAYICGNVLQDEKVFGTVHIAFGNNTSYDGGTNYAAVHEDVIIEKPSLYFDDRKIIEDGKWIL